eukprot:CAMPEP_0204840398 /NCGR_PEP_ID=MMETSP1346-20131115/37601_1 /ASSEMBLY_ACC=CAM_ASM_000771 /TAXON_ID=215587 /ORGANISM="Aplanochytrium stocchinoi, Strain GSBS06" /LENGTH=241 /DNA_ID=CAMNT_0051977783 /DNA_START=11 /DNA_END=732 /DNA_ORIENTATION=+
MVVIPDAAVVGITEAVASPVETHYESVFGYYSVPSFVFSRMGWRKYNRDHRWYSTNHPNFVGHIFLANVMAYSFGKALCDELDRVPNLLPPRLPEVSAMLETCEEPTNFYSAYYGTQPLESSCKLYEDRPGKPGYICSKNENVVFNVTFGRHPRLIVSYLQSYDHKIDDALLEFDGTGYQKLLMGSHSEKVSQTKSVFFFAAETGFPHIIQSGLKVKPFSSHKMTVRPKNNGKIKIISVVS